MQPEIITTPIPPAQVLLPRKFFLLFDFAFNNGIGLEKARKAALHFIDTQLQPQDEICLLSYSAMKSLTLHENLTADHEAVRQAVKRIGIERIAGRAEIFEEEYWQSVAGVNPVDASKSGSVFGSKEFSLRDAPRWMRHRKESTIHAQNFAKIMVDLAKALRYVPGHKC
ncbi:MAG: hypothetical protein GTN76_14020, partial [Candidatus Aenigmarchaeota archaeon]|nr:hypothetical protein [Candidatus Aenigmarchaeota archaeon]